MTTNPTYNNTPVAQFSLAETAAYILALGNKTSGDVSKPFVEYLFG